MRCSSISRRRKSEQEMDTGVRSQTGYMDGKEDEGKRGSSSNAARHTRTHGHTARTPHTMVRGGTGGRKELDVTKACELAEGRSRWLDRQ